MRRLVPALAAALLLVVAGCGSGSGSGSSSGSTASQQRSFAAFSKCLKQHGVKGFGVPGQGQGFGGGAPPSGQQGRPPSGGGFPAVSSMLRKAIAACRALAPQRQGQGGVLPGG